MKFLDHFHPKPAALSKKIDEGTHKTEFTSSASIFRVPEELRKLKESAYTPRLISIGPLHSNDHNLKSSPARNIKMSYVNSLLCRSSRGGSNERNKSTLLTECLNQMSDSLDEAKKSYVEEVDDELDEEMLVIDGCFILELLYRFKHEECKKSNDPIFGSVLMADYIRRDLLLLENQLPFFVLQKLFDLTITHIPCTNLSLIDYVISFFGDILNTESKVNERKRKMNKKDDYHHILHILHNHYNPQTKPRPHDLNQSMASSSHLDYAGIKFVTSKPPVSGEELKIRFIEHEGLSKWIYRPRFEIPTLFLYDSTEPFLRNLIAFEQYRRGVRRYFTSYADFMDRLISSSEDVQVLEKAGILRNQLGAVEDATNLFNNLRKEVVLNEFYFTEAIRAADRYSKHLWSDFMARLRRKYFASPGSFIAFCAAAVTFVVAAIKFISKTFHIHIHIPI